MKEESIWVMDFPNQLIREKVMMPEPDRNDFVEPDYEQPGNNIYFPVEHNAAVKKYNDHVASRRTFSYAVSKEQDGKEIPETEFKIQCGNSRPCNCEAFNQCKKPIAIPIDNIGETDHQYEEGLPDKPEQVNNMNELAHLYAKEKSINGVDYKIVKRDFIAGYKAALSSPPDPASKEQENDAVGFAEWIMENGWIPDKEYKQWMKMIKGKWKDLTAEQLYQLYKSKP